MQDAGEHVNHKKKRPNLQTRQFWSGVTRVMLVCIFFLSQIIPYIIRIFVRLNFPAKENQTEIPKNQ